MSRRGRGSGKRGGFSGRMPNSSLDAFNGMMSWSLVSRALDGVRDSSQRYRTLFDKAGEIHSKNIAATRAMDYGRLIGGIDEMRGRVSGAAGREFDTSINDFFKALQKNGGVNISNEKLSSTIGDFQKNVEKVAGSASGGQRDYLKDLVTELKHAKKDAAKGGLEAVGGDAEDIIKSSFGLKVDNTIDQARKDLVASIRETSKEIASPELRKALLDLQSNLVMSSAKAKNSDEKLDAIRNTNDNLTYLKARAKGDDKIAVGALQNQSIEKTDALTKGINGLARENKNGVLQRRILNLTRSMAGATKYFGVAKRSIDVGMDIFSKVNGYANNFSRMQMGVSAERGAYGRSIRGAGINFSHMTSALGAGRTAGLDDSEVVNQMVGLQGNLARARWGEGPLIDNLGKWGLSPFDANGNMKSNHQVMIDMSRKLNSMKDPMEKLQFLQMQGFRPDQMEYVQNYEKSAKRTEFLKAHPEAMGTLDKANYLDESGFSAKADAATKTELRRREVLNQSALEEGFGSYMMRKINPENWLLSDFTARRQGVASAKSDIAMTKLTDELRDLTDEIKKNGGVVGKGSLSDKESKLTAKELKDISLSGGWAEQSKREYGDKSVVNLFRGVVNRGNKGVSSETQKSINKATGAGVGAAGGLGVGAILGAIGGVGAALVGSMFTGGATALAIPAILGATLGGVSGGVAGGILGSKGMEETSILDFSDADAEAAREAASGSDEDWREWKKKTGLTNLTRKQVLDKDFDKQSLEGAKMASLVAKASERTGGKEIDINSLQQVASDKYLGKMTEGMDKSSQEYEDQLINAIARIADETVGRGDAMLHILQKGITVNDPDVKKRAEEIQKELVKGGKTPVEVKEQAEKQAVEEAKQDAAVNGDIINAAVEQKRKANDEHYAEYAKKNGQELADDKEYSNTVDKLKEQWAKEGRSMSFEDYTKQLRNWGRGNKSWKVQAAFRMQDLEESGPEHYNKETGKYERRHSNVHMDENGEIVGGAVTKGEKTKTKEEWDSQNWGSDAQQQLQSYLELTGKGGALEGQDIPWDKLPDAVKQYKISKQLEHQNYGGSKNSNQGNDFADLDDDAIVAKIANETGAKEEEVRSNILTKEQYDNMQKKIENGEEVSNKEQAKMRIYESSSSFKNEKEKKDKEAEEKKVQDAEGVNDIATYTAAADMFGDSIGNGGYRDMASSAVVKYGLFGKDKARFKELEEKKNRTANRKAELEEKERTTLLTIDERDELDAIRKKGNGLSAEENEELSSLEERDKKGTHTTKLTNTEAYRKKSLEDKKKSGDITEDESKELEGLQDKESTRKLSATDRKRMQELRAKQNGFTVDEQAEYENLAQRSQNMAIAKVDRKKLIKLASVRGGDWKKNFSQEEIAAFEKEQKEEKDRLTGGGRMSEGKYKLYKNVEAKILRGEEVSAKDRELYDSTQKTLKKSSGKGFKSSGNGLHRQSALTKEERAAMSKTFSTADKLDKERKKAMGKVPLAQQSDMRLIDEAKKKGWSEKKIRQHYGADRLKQYDEEVKKGTRKDPSKHVKRATYRPTTEGLMAAGMSEEKAKEVMGQWKQGEKGKEGGTQATEAMKAKEEGVAQASDKMASAGAAAESAAESAKNAGGVSKTEEKNVTINLGGQTITQNIQGNTPMDKDGMKQGTMQGVDEIRNKTAEALVEVAESKGTF